MTRHAPSTFARPAGWRLFVTVWIIYAAFTTTNVVRETYLAISLGERGSVRVDRFQGLHPDLFEIPGRGWYINSNPGTSIIGAVPYALLVRPAIALATAVRPGIVAPKPPATYDDPRPNRTNFMNAARARGLDIVLGMAAIGTGVTLMAPLGALSALLMFLFLRSRLTSERDAAGLALVFAFATPMLFRSAFINQNAVVTHLVLMAWILHAGLTPRAAGIAPSPGALAGIGLALGYAVVTDFSAIPFLVVFGCWILADGWRRGGPRAGLLDAARYAVPAVAAMAVLPVYQWVAFGHPIWPAQRYMPPTEFSVRGWLGFTWPTTALLWGNLFDPRYGLFAFSPLLLAALAAPFVRRRAGTWGPTMRELAWSGAAVTALLLFSSANQFANLQWNTGVRYMVPAVPLLFLAAIPVMAAMPRAVRWMLVGGSGLVSLAVSMTREAVPDAFRVLADGGPTLPVLLVLRRMASGYGAAPWWAFWVVAALVAVALLLVWRPALAPERA